MSLFHKNHSPESKTYDHENQKPVIKCSICTGEQVAGFKNIHTGVFDDVMLIKSPADLENFRKTYGIRETSLEKIY